MGFEKVYCKVRLDVIKVVLESVYNFVICFFVVEFLCMRGFINNLKGKCLRLKYIGFWKRYFKIENLMVVDVCIKEKFVDFVFVGL